MNIIYATLFFLMLFTLIELARKKLSVNNIEISRKAIHIASGLSAVCLPFFLYFYEITILGFLIGLIMAISKYFGFFYSVHGVTRTTYGEIYLPIGIGLTAYLLPYFPFYSFGILVVTISDGLASIFGQRYGVKKWKISTGKKTPIGSLTFFLSTIAIVVLFIYLGYIEASPLIFVIFLFISGLLTIIEVISPLGLDNLILPIISSALLKMITTI